MQPPLQSLLHEVHTSFWSFCLGVILLVLWNRSRKRQRKLPLPPGPLGLPIIGNILNMPTKNIAAILSTMCSKYGDVVYLNILGQSMIVLGSHEAAIDLLDKRSANYSDRPPSVLIDMSGFNFVLPFQRYGSWWRQHRRAFHQYFTSEAILGYVEYQRTEAHRLALRLIRKPKDFSHHARHLFGSEIMRVVYGIEVDEEPIDHLRIAEDAVNMFSSEFEPGKHLVETIPFFRFLPSWMPGARFKRDVPKWKEIGSAFRNVPWNSAKAAVAEGKAKQSMAAELMTRTQAKGDEALEEETIYRNTAASAYGGTVATSSATLDVFFLAMASFPEVQDKAQKELDAVVGSGRLPEFSDMDSLPYLDALMKELIRWRVVTPVAVPHRSVEEDEYRGYRIPKGSIVIPLLWALARDPVTYPNPEVFMPERFLTKEGRPNPDVRDPSSFTFGYGRRICPGRAFAQSALSIIIATVLHTLSIRAPVDSNGDPVRLEGKMTDGLAAFPEPFECTIEPRSKEAEELVVASCGEDPISV